MGTQAMVLGLERRESERRANREPLEEVAGLNERLFFTRSVRKSRQGYIVFILDNKTEKQPGPMRVQPLLIFIKGTLRKQPGLIFRIR